MDAVTEQLQTLSREIADLGPNIAAAWDAYMNATDPQQKAELKERYDNLDKQLQECRSERRELRRELQRKLPSSGVATAADPALDAFMPRIAELSPPSTFAKAWRAYQYTVSEAGELECNNPLLNVYRPAQARGLPAAFAHEAFGSFLDEKLSAPITTSAAKTVFRLVNILSHSYLPTNTRAIQAAVAKSLPGFKGWPGSQEAQLMQKVRNVLLDYLRAAMPEDTAFSTLEPSPSSESSSNATDGTGRLRTPEGELSDIHILMLEGKSDWGQGGGSNPVMQLCGFYARYLYNLRFSSAVAETILPAVGVEIFGHGIRIHALFYTDRICCEPLTEWVHFADLRHGQPGYMLYLVRIMDAFGKLCSALSSAMVPYTDAGPAFGQAREQQLTDGIPYMLRNPRYSIKRMDPKKHVFLLTPTDSDSGDATFVAKMVATPYPEHLHDELSSKGLAPGLIEPVQKYPGGVSVIKMAYLDPADGWVSLRSYNGDWEQLEQLAKASVAALHKCLDSSAVHGDLSADNVFVRMAKPEPGAGNRVASPEALQFIDLAWGGKQDEARYPPFVNENSLRGIKEADGQVIQQEHDREQLSLNMERLKRKLRAPIRRASVPPAARMQRASCLFRPACIRSIVRFA